MYADSVTPQMQAAIDETERRRSRQQAYNAEHGITPATIRKAIRRGIEVELRARRTAREAMSGTGGAAEETFDRDQLIVELEKEMLAAAERLEFEKAARLRDQVSQLREMPAGGAVARPRDGRDAEAAKPGAARSRAGISRGRRTGRRRD